MTATETPTLNLAGKSGTVEVVPGKYFVKLTDKDTVVVVVNVLARNKLAKFDHPNLLAKRAKDFGFKHSNRSGRKWWTYKAGVELYFALPKSALNLIAEDHGSYPKFVIGGEVVGFSSSGGTYGPKSGAWIDLIGDSLHSLVDLKKPLIEAVANAALSVAEAKAAGVELNIRPLAEDEKANLKAILAREQFGGKKLKVGSSVYLAGGYKFAGATGPFTYAGPIKSSLLLTVSGGGQFKAGPDLIDWSRLPGDNGLAVEFPEEFNRVS